jgi:integrase
MRIKLEEGTPWSLRVPAGKPFVQVVDTETPGLMVRLYASGRAVAAVRYEANGKERFKVIRDLTKGTKWLAAARSDALDVRAGARLGKDVVAEGRVAKAEAKAQGQTFAVLRDEYLEFRKHNSLPNARKNRGTRPRYLVEIKRQLEHDWKPLDKLPIRTIERQKIVDTLAAIAKRKGKRGGQVAADRAKAALSGFVTWCICGGILQQTPMLKLPNHAGDRQRDRVLTPQELIDIWAAAEAVGGDYETIVKLLVLCGMRRDEVGGMQWVEVMESGHYAGEEPGTTVDIGLHFDIPGDRIKNRLPLMMPLNKQARALLPVRPDAKDATARTAVFGRKPHGHGYSGWSRSKAKLDEEIAAIRKKRGELEPMPPFHLQQDLRRTFSTRANEMGLGLPHVIEVAINHVSGDAKNGVAGTYNKAQYLAQRIELFNRWGAYIDRLVSPKRQPLEAAA